MAVAYIMVKEQDKILPLCASLTPQVEPFKEEGIFLGLDAAGVKKLEALEIYNKGRFAIAASKFTAKAACMVLGDTETSIRLETHEEAAFLAPLSVDFLWPLSDQVIKHLKILGMHRIGEVTRISREELCLQFGDQGKAIYNYSRGIDKGPVLSKYPPNNLQVKRSLGGSINGGIINKEALKTILDEILADVSRELSSRNGAAQYLSVEFIEENGHTSSINKSFVKPVSVFNRGLVESIVTRIKINSSVVEVRVTAGDLRTAQFAQGVLWEDKVDSEKSNNKVRSLASSIQKRLPHQRICFASELQVSRREKVLSVWDPFRFFNTW